MDGCEDAVRANFEAACERLARAGVRIERMTLPAFEEALDVMSQHGSIVGAEALYLHAARLADPEGARLDRRVRKRIASGANMSAVDLLAVLERQRQDSAQHRAG
jgi:aspartyl-tRNA(Asn)/glutamyl-tRNA(Gln) amidotransferase subunit A